MWWAWRCPVKTPFQKPVHSALGTEASRRPLTISSFRASLSIREAAWSASSAQRAGLAPECSKCFPASRFDFFCPILLLVLSLGTQTLSRLLLLEHSAFNRKTLGSLKVSGVQIQQVSQYQYVESFLYCPKDFCATGQDPMVRQNEWEVHTFPWWSKWGAEDGDQLTHHSHFPFSVDF